MNHLPYELLFSIAIRLDSPRDLCSFSQVCSSFLTVSRDDRIWKWLCERFYNIKSSLTMDFYHVFTTILARYGRYLGYWKSNEQFVGGLIYVKLDLQRRTIVGERIQATDSSNGGQTIFFDEETSFQPSYSRTTLFTIDTTSHQIFCHECNMPHLTLPWTNTISTDEKYFGLSQELLPVEERSSLLSHDHPANDISNAHDVFFERQCPNCTSLVYHPVSMFKSDANNDHSLSRLNGFWVGSYGGHGLELLCFEARKQFLCPIIVDDNDSNKEEIVPDVLVATKLSGDRNVPHGRISFVALRPINEQSNSHQSYKGIGQIADTGYVDPQFIRTKITIISNDEIIVTWYMLHHSSSFKRCHF